MAANEIHLNDIGTIFELTLMDDTVVVDVSTAITKEIIFEKPDKTTTVQTASFTTDGTDGKIRYVVISGDLDQIGSWRIQGKVTLPTGTWSSDISKFKVYDNL